MEEIIKVDFNDNHIGKIEKLKAHTSPILHRAFSVFLFDGNKMLIQKRAEGKYHSGGLWANACCSHPRANKSFKDSVLERIKFELGIVENIDLNEVFSFTYLSKYAENLYEYEFDHVLIGKYNSEKKINYNTEEISEVKWIEIAELKEEMLRYPQNFATWFIICANKAIDAYMAK